MARWRMRGISANQFEDEEAAARGKSSVSIRRGEEGSGKEIEKVMEKKIGIEKEKDTEFHKEKEEKKVIEKDPQSLKEKERENYLVPGKGTVKVVEKMLRWIVNRGKR